MIRRANYQFIEDGETQLVIADIGPRDVHPTVTNDAEHVVEELAPQLKGRCLFYYDSDNRCDEIVIKDGKFAGFAPAGEVDQEEHNP